MYSYIKVQISTMQNCNYFCINLISDKGLISQIYKELRQFNSRKSNELNLKWTKDLSRHFPKENIKVAYMERYSISLFIREMQIKTTMRYHSQLLGWLLSKRQEITNTNENVEKRELLPFEPRKGNSLQGTKYNLYTVGGDVNWFSYYKKYYGGFSRN